MRRRAFVKYVCGGTHCRLSAAPRALVGSVALHKPQAKGPALAPIYLRRRARVRAAFVAAADRPAAPFVRAAFFAAPARVAGLRRLAANVA